MVSGIHALFAFQDTVTNKRTGTEICIQMLCFTRSIYRKGTRNAFFFFLYLYCFYIYIVFIQDTITETGTEMGIVLHTRYSYRNRNIKFIMHCFAYKIQLQKQKRIVLHTRYSYRNRNRNGHCFCIVFAQDTVTETGTETHCFAFQSSSYRNRNTDGYTGVVVCETTDPNIERSYNYTNRYR